MATPCAQVVRQAIGSLQRNPLIKKLFRASQLRDLNLGQHLKFLRYIKATSLKACNPSVFRSILLSAVCITAEAASATVETAGSSKSFEPNDPRLRSHECLKNAAGLSVDSTSAVLSQTVYALTKIEEQYVELVDVLVVLMEYQLQVLGHRAEEERIGDLIVETRHEITKVKQRKEDLQLLFASVEKLADATAEVAFASGAEYASTSAGERLYSAQREVQRVRGKSQEADRRLREAQARSVEVQAKHEEREKEREKRDAPHDTSDVMDGASSSAEVIGGHTEEGEVTGGQAEEEEASEVNLDNLVEDDGVRYNKTKSDGEWIRD